MSYDIAKSTSAGEVWHFAKCTRVARVVFCISLKLHLILFLPLPLCRVRHRISLYPDYKTRKQALWDQHSKQASRAKVTTTERPPKFSPFAK